MGGLRIVPGEGEWLVLADWPTLVLLPSSVPADLAERIRRTLRDEPTLESVVSVVPVRGASALASFAVVRFEDDGDAPSQRVSGVVRGAAAVDLLSIGGARRFGSQGAEPWALAEFSDVVGLTAGVLPPVPESPLRLPPEARKHDRGVALGSTVIWAAVMHEVVVADAPADAPHDDTDDDTVVKLATPEAPDSAHSPQPEPRPRHEPRPQPEHRPQPEPVVDHAPVPSSYTIRVDDSHPLDLAGALVIGRRPHERRTPTAVPQRLVEVASPTRQVSSNHVEIALSGRTVVITDLRSANGTVVRPAGASPVRLRQGDSFVATGSAIVEIGDGHVIHISSRDRGNSGITV